MSLSEDPQAEESEHAAHAANLATTPDFVNALVRRSRSQLPTTRDLSGLFLARFAGAQVDLLT